MFKEGILVFLDFNAKTATESLSMENEDIEDFVETINLEGEDCDNICFAKEYGNYYLEAIKFSDIRDFKMNHEYFSYILSVLGKVKVSIILTNGEKIYFETQYDRFWILTGGTQIRIETYEDYLLELQVEEAELE